MSKNLKPARIWRQRGILIALFSLFLVSGLLRLGDIDIAFAATGSETTIEDSTGSSEGQTGVIERVQEIASDTQQCATLGSIEVALAAINRRAEELDVREANVSAREANLEAAEAVILEQLQELEATEERLRGLLTIADTAADDDLAQLTSLYESMEAEDAAELFGQMEPSFAAGFLARMRPEAGAGILSELEPNQAYAISVILATRNTNLADAMLNPAQSSTAP